MLVSVLSVGCLLAGGILSNVPVANATSMQVNQKPGQRVGQQDQKPGQRVGQHGHQQSLFQFHIISQVASILNVDEQTVIDELQAGNTLVEIAESHDVSESTLVSDLEALLGDAIDDAVTAGTITDAQATEMKSKLTERLTQLVEGTSNISLSAPTHFNAIAEGSSEIYLDWDSVSDATSYYIYRATSSFGTYTIVDTVTTTSYTDDNLSDDTTYYYKVKAVNSSGTSDYSSTVQATTSDEFDELSVPNDLTAIAESSSEIYLDWDSVSDATSYYIYRATSRLGTYAKVDTVTTTSYTNDDLSDDTTYYYKVKAVNSSGTSAYSSSVHATTED